MNVYIWTSGELKNDYIGEYQEWEPDASRTLLYLPLESNTNDYSWNNRTCTPTSVTYTTVGGVVSAHVDNNWWILLQPDNFITKTTSTWATLSALVYVTSQTSSARRYIWEWAKQNNAQFFSLINNNVSYYTIWWGNAVQVSSNSWTVIANKRNHILYTVDSTAQKLYINWTLAITWSWTSYPRWNPSAVNDQWQYVLCSRFWPNNSQSLNWNAREIIWENIVWSSDDVTKYYQRIKAKLWF